MAMTARVAGPGLRPYREVWRCSTGCTKSVREGREPDTWIFVEHPPVITLGRAAKRENCADLAGSARGARRRRRGDRTRRRRDLSRPGPARGLSDPRMRTLPRNRSAGARARGGGHRRLPRFGVAGERWTEHAGVWVGTDQICAIGLAVRKMVSLHGIALNASTELDYDRLINPCGLTRPRHHVARAAKPDVTSAVAEAKGVLDGRTFAQRSSRFECVTA